MKKRQLKSNKGDLIHDGLELAIDIAEMFKNRQLWLSDVIDGVSWAATGILDDLSHGAKALGFRQLEAKKGDLIHDGLELPIDIAEMFKNRQLGRKENIVSDALHVAEDIYDMFKKRSLNLDTDMQNFIHDVEAFFKSRKLSTKRGDIIHDGLELAIDIAEMFKNRQLGRKENIVGDALHVVEDIYDMMKKRQLKSNKGDLIHDALEVAIDVAEMFKNRQLFLSNIIDGVSWAAEGILDDLSHGAKALGWRKLNRKENLDTDMQNLIHDVEAMWKNR